MPAAKHICKAIRTCSNSLMHQVCFKDVLMVRRCWAALIRLLFVRMLFPPKPEVS